MKLTGASFGPLYLKHYKTSVPEVVYQATWQRLLSGAKHEYRGLMAFQGDCAVGLAHYLFHRHCRSVENVCYLQDFGGVSGLTHRALAGH